VEEKMQPHEIFEKAEEIKHWIERYERMPEGLEKEKEWGRISAAQSKLLEDAQESKFFVPLL
jgi:hypothetical protein